MCQVIAEISWCHIGDMSLAERMVDAAVKSGATYAKFQTWSVKNLKPGPWDNDGRRDIYEAAELTPEQHEWLKRICSEKGIQFLTSCFSSKDVDLVASLSDKVKIPSPELANLPLLEAVAGRFKTVYLSTGASTEEEIGRAVQILKHTDLTLLHCVSNYPCPPDRTNLPRIEWLARTFGTKVGYSGHVEGIDDAVASLEYDVSLIEKHFTVDRNLPGRDNKFAILPEEMGRLCSYIERRRDMRKSHGSNYSPTEQEVRDKYRGRWDA